MIRAVARSSPPTCSQSATSLRTSPAGSFARGDFRTLSMTYPLRMFSGFIALWAIGHNACAVEAIPSCDSFKAHPNGSLSVVKPVMVATPYGKVILQPGISFSGEEKPMGLDLFALYERVCPKR
jgi:hypothetical protein